MWMAAWTPAPSSRKSAVPVFPGDTAESLHARIQVAEHALFPAVLAKLADAL